VEEALRLDLNRGGTLDAKLRFAIGNRLLLQLRYSSKTRVVEPHDFGLQKGTARLLAFQRGGPGDMHGRSVSGWRLFDLAKIEACVVLEETFAGSRGALHERHYVWDQLYARVE
jgi:predicted DNA-binding transcriptional regulator YafY